MGNLTSPTPCSPAMTKWLPVRGLYTLSHLPRYRGRVFTNTRLHNAEIASTTGKNPCSEYFKTSRQERLVITNVCSSCPPGGTVSKSAHSVTLVLAMTRKAQYCSSLRDISESWAGLVSVAVLLEDTWLTNTDLQHNAEVLLHQYKDCLHPNSRVCFHFVLQPSHKVLKLNYY